MTSVWELQWVVVWCTCTHTWLLCETWCLSLLFMTWEYSPFLCTPKCHAVSPTHLLYMYRDSTMHQCASLMLTLPNTAVLHVGPCTITYMSALSLSPTTAWGSLSHLMSAKDRLCPTHGCPCNPSNVLCAACVFAQCNAMSADLPVGLCEEPSRDCLWAAHKDKVDRSVVDKERNETTTVSNVVPQMFQKAKRMALIMKLLERALLAIS